ncbi:MAG: hypothetical protein ACR2IE_03180 [Candidatus Sumerlaeaceae bacterium]
MPRPQPQARSSRLAPSKGISAQAVKTFHRRLEKLFGGTIDLRVNDNTSTLLSANRPRGSEVTHFSVHKMFLDADDEILAALAQYLRRPTQRSQRLLRCYMDARTADIRARRISPKVLSLRARGRTYDLHKIAAEVNEEFFGGELRVYVTWSRGSNPRGCRRRHIVFGSYDSRTRLIRIHPALDDANVPEFFVRFVVFHEMLHAVLDPTCADNGRRCVHTPAFRTREKQHPDYARAMKWEREFMSRG